jgi:hypothetical protein
MIEDRIADLVGHFIGVAHGDRFTGKKVVLRVHDWILEKMDDLFDWLPLEWDYMDNAAALATSSEQYGVKKRKMGGDGGRTTGRRRIAMNVASVEGNDGDERVAANDFCQAFILS